MIVGSNADGGVTGVSPEWRAFTGRAFTGRAAPEAGGHGWLRCMHPHDDEPAVAVRRQAQDHQGESSRRLRRADARCCRR
ncbi:hypothetical protein [Methylobacterium planeticum]|uniref:PAS domain-containing protein n=1 Tax=Methylobacterium planeticum TaxID=2615211 RepID=A0A6N6MP14_9HYPH|nr:hypothetical protein [Methylobacterium planeticum]KAB1073223.1 hypothetical protein F6X51_12840 [Methylobacterium planeticum]